MTDRKLVKKVVLNGALKEIKRLQAEIVKVNAEFSEERTRYLEERSERISIRGELDSLKSKYEAELEANNGFLQGMLLHLTSKQIVHRTDANVTTTEWLEANITGNPRYVTRR